MPNSPPEFVESSCLSDAVLKSFLGECGEEVCVYSGCRIVPGEKVRLGSRSQIDEGVFIFAGEGVEIGVHVHVAFGASISGGGACRIGDFASIGAGVRILTGTDNLDASKLNNPTIPSSERAVLRRFTDVGAFSLVFTNSIVFPGVNIGEGTVVAAGSIVHHDLLPWTVYAGNPLVPVSDR